MSAIAQFFAQQAEVPRLKREARKHYEAYQRILGDLDCGRYMGEYMRPEAITHRNEFNTIMDKLAKLDSTCPLTRL